MRSFRHWTPRYIWDRFTDILHRQIQPERPWLAPTANVFLESFLRKTDIGLEFGSGRSTIWFARRVAFLTSVEHDRVWHERIKELLNKHCLFNVNYLFYPYDVAEEEDKSHYVRTSHHFADNSLDFALVDGIYREACALASVDKIRPGGILIIDNANWYLPSDSRSANSRSREEGPASARWGRLLDKVARWRCLWTTGVHDTAIFIKPCRG